MSNWQELDVIIKERTDGQEPEQIQQLKDEIDLHLSGGLIFEQLSPFAQDIIRDWESVVMAQIEEEERYFGYGENEKMDSLYE